MEKNVCLSPWGPWWTHRWPPTVRGPGCPPAPPSHHVVRGLGVSLGESQGWKPQKVVGCGWTRCHRISDLIHVAQDMARSWFSGWLTRSAHNPCHFWPFFGRVADISWSYRATKCSFTSRGRHTWNVGTVSLRLAVLNGFWGKKGYVGAEIAQFWGGTSRLGATPLGAPLVNFWLKHRIWQGHQQGSTMARVQ